MAWLWLRNNRNSRKDMTFEAFIIEMIFFIEMAGSRYARPRRLRLSLTKPLRRRGWLRTQDEALLAFYSIGDEMIRRTETNKLHG